MRRTPGHQFHWPARWRKAGTSTIVGDDGSFVGHVDLGSLGVADRWADLAVASWSLEWDFGPGHEQAFWDAYGIAPDPERIAQYRALWGDAPTS